MRFWEVIKEVSAQPVRQEARRLFVLALAGDPEPVAAARRAALGPAPTPEEASRAGTYLFYTSPPYTEETEKRLRYADLLVSLPGGPGVTEFRPADTIRLESGDDLVPRVLAHRPDLRVSLARQLPGFRDLAAEHLIRDVSRVNAEFAALSTVTTTIPFLAPFLPAVAGTDVFVLTKNQILMMFRLAAIYGEDLDLKSRVREVLPVIGSALGWRSLARTLVGALPGALGLPLKTGIAYSATYAAGRVAQMTFDEGRRPTRQEMLRIYEDGARLAREMAGRLKERFEREKDGGRQAAQPALPAPVEGSPEEGSESEGALPTDTPPAAAPTPMEPLPDVNAEAADPSANESASGERPPTTS